MKTLGSVTLMSFLVFAGLAPASQSEEQKQDPSMMEQMMKGQESMKGMSGMDGMMRMMKMMEECSAMMQSSDHESKKAKESHK